MPEPPAPELPVLVAVVTHDSADVLPGLLESLPAGFGAVPWRTVVVDNASRDGSADLARRLDPTAVVVEPGVNGGYAAGLNAAVAAGPPHRAVLVLNPDVRLDPGCVPRLLAALDGSPASSGRPVVGIAVPRLRDARGVRIDSQRREPTLVRALADLLVGATRAGRWGRIGEVVTDERAYSRATDTDWAEGSTQLVSAACWAACDGWDESFFLYSEEADFALRARDLGYATRYVPAAGAVHLEGGSAGSARLWPLLTVNRLRLYRRRHAGPAVAAFWAVLVLRESSRALLGRAASRAAVRVLLTPALLRRPAGPDWLR